MATATRAADPTPAKRAATVVILRESTTDGDLLALVGQIDPVNAIKTTAEKVVLNPFPGEFRFLGGRALENELTPIETATRELRDIGFPYLDEFPLRMTLLHKKRRFGSYEMYNFVADVRDNPQVLGVDISVINEHLRHRREARARSKDVFVTLSIHEKMQLCPKVHHVEWVRVRELLLRIHESRPFVNEFQREAFAALGVSEREPAISVADILHEVLSCGSIDRLRASSLQRYVETIAIAKNIPRTVWERELYTTQARAAPVAPASPEPSRRVEAIDLDRNTFMRFRDSVPLGEPSASAAAAAAAAAATGANVRRVASSNGLAGLVAAELAPSSSSTAQLLNAIRVLSYNINVLPMGVASFLPGHGMHASARLAEFLARLVSPHAPVYDIVCLQELFATPLLPGCRQRYFIAKLREHGFSHVVHSPVPSLGAMLLRRQLTDSGLVVASRYPIIASDAYTFRTSGAAADAGAAKGVIYALVEIGQHCLHVFNVHLQASHTADHAGDLPIDFAAIRASQLAETMRFVRTKTHSTAYSWLLTGDLNIDAIADQANTGSFGFSFLPAQPESSEYRSLMHQISPRGNVIDLLHVKEGRHVSTRPPRLQFPASVQSALRHKYPQRLDYIFFRPGSTGGITCNYASTRIVKFAVKAAGQIHSPRMFAGASEAAQPATLPPQVQAAPMQAQQSEADPCAPCADEQAGSEDEPQADLPFEFLSDHFGIETVLIGENTLTWDQPRIAKLHEPIANAAPLVERQPLGGRRVLLVLLSLAVNVWLGLTLGRFFAWSHVLALLCLLPLAFVQGMIVYHMPGRLRLDQQLWFPRERTPFRDRAEAISELHAVRERQTEELAEDRKAIGTLHDSFMHGVRFWGYRDALGSRRLTPQGGLGEYQWQSYDETALRVQHFGSGMLHLAMAPGARVGILADNCAEWVVVDQACAMYSLVSVPLFSTSEAFLDDLLCQAQAELIVCSADWTPLLCARFAAGRCPRLRLLVQIARLEYEHRRAAELVGLRILDFADVEQRGAGHPLPALAPRPHDLATVIFRWRHEGPPLELRLTHSNMAAAIASVVYEFRQSFSEKDVHYSYIPLVHVGERVLLAAALQLGMRIGFFGGVASERIFDDIRALKPTFLVGTTMVFRNIYRHFISARQSWTWLYRCLFDFAYAKKAARIDAFNRAGNAIWAEEWYDRLIFRHIAQILGGRLRTIISFGRGATRIQRLIEVVFCVPMLELTVLPEACGPALVSLSPASARSAPMHGIEMRLEFDGEATVLHVRGPAVVGDGWLNTGLVCEAAGAGELVIHGSRSSLVRGPHNRLISLERLEAIYTYASDLIHQVWLWCTPDQPLVAVVVVDVESAYGWARSAGLLGSFDAEALCSLRPLETQLMHALRAAWEAHSLHEYEQLTRILVVSEPFSSANALASPTYTLCRSALEARYGPRLRAAPAASV